MVGARCHYYHDCKLGTQNTCSTVRKHNVEISYYPMRSVQEDEENIVRWHAARMERRAAAVQVPVVRHKLVVSSKPPFRMRSFCKQHKRTSHQTRSGKASRCRSRYYYTVATARRASDYEYIHLIKMAENVPPAAPAPSAENANPSNAPAPGSGPAPADQNTSNRGLPYYEKLRRELRDTLQRKRIMDKSMVSANITCIFIGV